MRGTALALLTIALIVLVVVGFLLTNPNSGQTVLSELGLITPEPERYQVSGILEAEAIYLSSPNGGRLVSVDGVEGQEVRSGQLIARLDADLLEKELEAVRAGYDAAWAQLQLLQAGATAADLAVAQAELDFAEVGLLAAQQALEDARALDEALPTRTEQIALAQAQGEQAQAAYDLAVAGLRALVQAPSEFELGPAQAAVESASASIQRLEAQIEEQFIRSPIDGAILETFIKPGELALPGRPVAAVAPVDNLELTVYIPQGDLNWVALGQEVEVRVDAYPERGFLGRIIEIARRAEFTPSTVQTPDERETLVHAITILVENPGDALKPGLPADATFTR